MESFSGRRLMNISKPLPRQHGKVAEYAILLGLLGVLSIASLQGLGLSIFHLPNSVAKTMETHSTLSVLDIKPAFTSSQPMPTLPVNGYYKVVTDSATGKPSLQLVNTNEEVVNVSSVDGNQLNTLGTFRLADYLDQLAQRETDPAIQEYYAQMAKLAYYMGANEAELDDFDKYSLQVLYSNGDALQDLMGQQSALQALMLNPPPGIKPQDLANVLPVTSEVFNISQNYSSHFSKFVGPDGKVTSNFSTISQGTFAKGLGSAMRDGTTTQPSSLNFQLRNKSYDVLVPYDQLKAQVKATLSQNKLPDTPVVTDFKDAVTIDGAANSG